MDPVSLDPASPDPPFEQVRTQLAAQVADGRLEPGERLPTVRALAGEVGLAVNTVARVYRELEADGVVATEGRRGTFVRAGGAPDDLRAAAAEYAARARAAGTSRAEALRLVDDAW